MDERSRKKYFPLGVPLNLDEYIASTVMKKDVKSNSMLKIFIL